jgi:YVTN family beta-propeller protein
LQGGAGLGVIDTASRKVTKVIPIPGLEGPHNLDLSKDEKTAFVRDTGNSVAAVDLASGKVKKLMKTGNGHAGIDVFPNGKYVVTGAIADEFITVMDAEKLEVIQQIKVGNGPHGVRASKDNRWLYVAVTADDKVVVVDTKTWKVTKEYKVGSFPFWVAVNGNP